AIDLISPTSLRFFFFCCPLSFPSPSFRSHLSTLPRYRMRVIEVVLSILRCNMACVNTTLQPLLVRMLDLFFEYQLNNFLHALVEQIIATILCGDDALLNRELCGGVHTHLVERLLLAREANVALEEAGGQRRGYMSHLVRLGLRVASDAT